MKERVVSGGIVGADGADEQVLAGILPMLFELGGVAHGGSVAFVEAAG